MNILSFLDFSFNFFLEVQIMYSMLLKFSMLSKIFSLFSATEFNIIAQ